MRSIIETPTGRKMVLHFVTGGHGSSCNHCGRPTFGMWTDDLKVWAARPDSYVRCVDVKLEPSPLAKITRKELFRQVDEVLSGKSSRQADPIWLLGAVVMLREVTKEDAPFVAHLHETGEEAHGRQRYGGAGGHG